MQENHLTSKAKGPKPGDIAQLFSAQVAAALEFQMEEVFAMTTEGLKGRLLMLKHAMTQGYAPVNAEKLVLFLNLELQERSAGREIPLDTGGTTTGTQSVAALDAGQPRERWVGAREMGGQPRLTVTIFA